MLPPWMGDSGHQEFKCYSLAILIHLFIGEVASILTFSSPETIPATILCHHRLNVSVLHSEKKEEERERIRKVDILAVLGGQLWFRAREDIDPHLMKTFVSEPSRYSYCGWCKA